MFDLKDGIRISKTTVIDSSRNLTNIAKLGVGKSPTDLIDVQVDNGGGQIATYRNNTGPFLHRTYADYNNDGVIVEYQERIGSDGNRTSIGNFSAHDFALRTNNTDRAVFYSDGGIRFFTNTTDSRVLKLRDRSNNLGNILQFEAYDGSNIWEIVGRTGGTYPFYIYKGYGTGSGYKWTINGSGDTNIFGSLTVSNDITAFSDERLKSEIKTLDGKKVLEMRGVSFTKDGKLGSGVIAQELEKVAPELVHTAEDEMGTKSVAYGNLVGYLIECVKEQQSEIDELKALVKQLLEK